MNRKVRRVTQRKVKVFILSVSLFFCGSFSYAAEIITVAVASSYYEKAKVYSLQFEQTHDVKVRLVSGSTGRLFNQIEQGAPFDIWIAADIKRPALLKAKHKLIGQGYLGIQVGSQISELKDLQHTSIKHIAIANPDVAPFGFAARIILQTKGLWKALQPKLVYAANAMQAAMMVKQGLTDAGFVPIADKTRALASVPYVAVLLSNKSRAKFFYHILGSEASASPSKLSYSATKVAHPSGSKASASPKHHRP